MLNQLGVNKTFPKLPVQEMQNRCLH